MTSRNCDRCETDCKGDCLDRAYVGCNQIIRTELAEIDSRHKITKFKCVGPAESQFPSFNGNFHKSLAHNTMTGSLSDQDQYYELYDDIANNRQVRLANIPLAPGSTIQLVDPLLSIASCLMGGDQAAFKLKPAFLLSSGEAAAEMIELYCQVLCRDVAFSEYKSNATITQCLAFLNDSTVQSYLPEPPAGGFPLTAKNIFRSSFPGSNIGPYTSQLLLLNTLLGAIIVEQKPLSYPTATEAIADSVAIEWCLNQSQAILSQNGNLTTLPAAPTQAQSTALYVYAGRNLAETVHLDASIEYYYFAANTLQALGVPWNPTLPSAPNQSAFATCGSGNAVQHALAEVCSLGLKHAWFWKWTQYRRLRPEVFGLWVDNVQNNRVANAANYNIAPFLFTNGVLPAIKTHNASFGAQYNSSYTLSGTYREGSPAHPSYPSGHSVVAGACCTILKLFFNAETLWSAIPGLQSTSINRKIVPASVTGPVVEANDDGTDLQNYTGSDASQMSVWGEINKVGTNICMGRDWAGIHYRSDGIEGMKLGEQIAESYFGDLLSSWVQNTLTNGNTEMAVPTVTFRKLDGTIGFVKPTLCRKRE